MADTTERPPLRAIAGGLSNVRFLTGEQLGEIEAAADVLRKHLDAYVLHSHHASFVRMLDDAVESAHDHNKNVRLYPDDYDRTVAKPWRDAESEAGNG